MACLLLRETLFAGINIPRGVEHGHFCNSPRKGIFERLFRSLLPNIDVCHGLNDSLDLNEIGQGNEDIASKEVDVLPGDRGDVSENLYLLRITLFLFGKEQVG